MITNISAQFVQGTPTSATAPQLVVGQTLSGVVQRVVPQGQTLIHVQGQPLLLTLNQPVTRGQTLTLTVEQVSPALVLGLREANVTAGTEALSALPLPVVPTGGNRQLGSGPVNPSRLLAYLAARQPFGQLVTTLTTLLRNQPVLSDLAPVLQARLQETLALLSSGGGAPPEASQLQAQVERSGLNYEAQVQRFLTAGSGDPALAERDLKGQLLELVQRLHQATAKAPSRAALEMVTHVEHALDTLEGQQVANQLAWQQQQPILIPLPNPLAAGIPTAQLWVQRHPPAPDTPTPELPAYRLVLLLDVSALGPLRVEALWHGSQLTATIQVHEPSVAAFISAQVTGFTDLLSALGVQAELTCRVQPPVQPALDDPLVACLRTSASGLVDLTI